MEGYKFSQLSVGDKLVAEETLVGSPHCTIPVGTRGTIQLVEWRGTKPAYHTKFDNGVLMVVSLPWTVGKI